jgi:hypothetical protein
VASSTATLRREAVLGRKERESGPVDAAAGNPNWKERLYICADSADYPEGESDAGQLVAFRALLSPESDRALRTGAFTPEPTVAVRESVWPRFNRRPTGR